MRRLQLVAIALNSRDLKNECKWSKEEILRPSYLVSIIESGRGGRFSTGDLKGAASKTGEKSKEWYLPESK